MSSCRTRPRASPEGARPQGLRSRLTACDFEGKRLGQGIALPHGSAVREDDLPRGGDAAHDDDLAAGKLHLLFPRDAIDPEGAC